jgi:hypothetical protein
MEMNTATSFSAENLAQIQQRQQLRLRALSVVKALFDQVRVIQQHRAATNGALGGNPFFESKTRLLAREVNARFKELDRLINKLHEFQGEQRWADIQNAWHTVHLQWRQDDAIENFELHSHLVKLMLDYIAMLGAQAEELIETTPEQKALALYVMKYLPAFIETLGQIRALGTHATVVEGCSDACALRLRFLVEQMHNQHANQREYVSAINREATGKLSALIEAQMCEPKLKQLDAMIVDDILGRATIKTKPDDLFTLSTHIIDAHYNVMNEGLRLVRLSMDSRILAWVNR